MKKAIQLLVYVASLLSFMAIETKAMTTTYSEEVEEEETPADATSAPAAPGALHKSKRQIFQTRLQVIVLAFVRNEIDIDNACEQMKRHIIDNGPNLLEQNSVGETIYDTIAKNVAVTQYKERIEQTIVAAIVERDQTKKVASLEENLEQ